jgi:hypothetical protein
MSGEFGSYNVNGYVDWQIEMAGYDCSHGNDELTRLFGKLFSALVPIMREICRSEASDSGPEDPIMTAISQMAVVDAAMDDIKKYLDTYRRVAQQAVRRAQENNDGGA